MSRNLVPLSLAASLLAGSALADVPRVAVDIAPVHSLVARVMDGVGSPSLIVIPGASPHEYSLRPSEATALQEADLVFWVSPDLTPWLEDAIETLAGGATVTALLETDGTMELPFREGALFDAHAHEGDEHADEDHDGDHKGHRDHDGEVHADDDEHAEHENREDEPAHDEDHADAKHAGHDDHGHGAHDPHAWLSPENGAVWLNAIAAQLSAADPDNADVYFGNAAAGREELADLSAEINATLDPVRGGNFIVFHDAYQ